MSVRLDYFSVASGRVLKENGQTVNMADLMDALKAALVDGSPAAARVQLTGSSVPDAQALPMTPAIRDIAARAKEAIIAEIGLDNIACFLPMDETSGSELRDLIHPSLKFRVSGATPGVVGPFGSAWACDGVDDIILEAPAIETAAGTAEAALDAGNKMLAQRIKAKTVLRRVAFVRLNLKRVGTPVGTLQVELREDVSGLPASTAVATSGTVNVAHLGTTATMIGFEIDPPFEFRQDIPYWLVLKWASATTVDATNHVTWTYDASGAYGEPRAVYNGTAWTATTGQSHGFQIHYDWLALKEGSYIVAFKPLVSALGYRSLFSHGLTDTRDGFRQLMILGGLSSSDRPWAFRDVGLNAVAYLSREINFDRYIVAALTISTAASTDKIVVYWNAQKVASVNGTANQASAQPRYPLALGGEHGLRYYSGSYGNGAGSGDFITSHIGAVIVTRNALTAQQVANVTRHLLALRLYGVTGV